MGRRRPHRGARSWRRRRFRKSFDASPAAASAAAATAAAASASASKSSALAAAAAGSTPRVEVKIASGDGGAGTVSTPRRRTPAIGSVGDARRRRGWRGAARRASPADTSTTYELFVAFSTPCASKSACDGRRSARATTAVAPALASRPNEPSTAAGAGARARAARAPLRRRSRARLASESSGRSADHTLGRKASMPSAANPGCVDEQRAQKPGVVRFAHFHHFTQQPQ